MIDDVLHHVPERVLPPLALQILVCDACRQPSIRQFGDEDVLFALYVFPFSLDGRYV